MSDDVQEVFKTLEAQGFEQEVFVIRQFITAMGESHREAMQIQRKIVASAQKPLKTPVPRTT